jgi:hypothetical protein
MFVNHDADPVRRMGRLVSPHKAGKSTQLGRASLKMVGVIDVQGDGAQADIRRDIAHGISVGDITAMSGRWDTVGEPVARASLPKGHYAFSDVSGGFSTPMFFEQAKVLEGSIVGVPADAAAMIGRSQDLEKPEHVRQFYDVLVNGDWLSRDRALESLYTDAASVEGLQEIETVDGMFFVPKDVARLWGLAIEDDPSSLSEYIRAELELAGEEPAQAVAERAAPPTPTRAMEITPEFLERAKRAVESVHKSADRKRTQKLYEEMGFIS